MTSKSYLLAHIAREIEGGIKDILNSGHKPNKGEIQKCDNCGNEINKSTHIDEICKALGSNKDDKFVQEWHNTAKEFHKYAHRHGAWKTPREKEIFNELWKRFEKF